VTGTRDVDVERFVSLETARLAAEPPSLPFTREEYAARLVRLRARMLREGVDVLVLTAPDSMCWLHGYQSRWYRAHSSTTLPPTQCTVVAAEDPMFLIETSFHEELVRLTSCVTDFRGLPDTGLDHEAGVQDYVRFLTEQLRLEGWAGGTVGLEAWSCVPNPAVFKAMEEALAEADCRVTDATAMIRAVRRLKSPAEIAMMERAQAAGDAGLLALQAGARPGMTELEAWNLFMAGQIAGGGEPTAIHETVAVGPPEPMLHSMSSRRRIQTGDYFHADVCGAVHRYHARGCRTFFMGDPPAELTKITEILAGACDVLAETARVGISFDAVAARLTEYYRVAGVPEGESFMGGYELGVAFPPDWVGEFCWGTGYDHGDAVVEAGLVTNLESVYFLALVDTVVFEETGPRLLSAVPREVLACG
jgi:Xaa-Pro aminopeptidase